METKIECLTLEIALFVLSNLSERPISMKVWSISGTFDLLFRLISGLPSFLFSIFDILLSVIFVTCYIKIDSLLINFKLYLKKYLKKT